MKKKQWTRYLIVISLVLVLVASVLLIRYANPKVYMYSGQYTYTTSDDQTVYLSRFPGIYVEPFLPFYGLNFIPKDTRNILEKLSGDSLKHVSNYMRRYHGHFNLDYSIKETKDKIVITYMGYGKLEDGTIETIDQIDEYPIFPFVDKTAGQWIPPNYPWENGGTEPLFQDPNQVIDPPYS